VNELRIIWPSDDYGVCLVSKGCENVPVCEIEVVESGDQHIRCGCCHVCLAALLESCKRDVGWIDRED
jgi:hypothetical protein